MVKKFITLLISVLVRIFGYIPALIYGYIYSEFFTKATYKMVQNRSKTMKNKPRSVLDVGTATGQPLYSIIQGFQDARVIGLDYDGHYIPACQKLFKDKKNVTIEHMNFYDLEKKYPNELFDIIIFGSSFMIMPDQSKALEIAKRKLTKTGKIYFLLTLYDEKSAFNSFMEVIKPSLKYMTTVDFGKVTYKKEFEDFMAEHQVDITFRGRCYGNFFLKFFKFYIYEGTKAA